MSADGDDMALEELVKAAVDRQDPTGRLDEHTHHLIRRTAATRTLDANLLAEWDLPPELAGADPTLEVTDVYCFTCEEWVGVSGIPLRGTLRSTDDAHYYRGPPAAVRDLQERIRAEFATVAARVVREHPHVENLDDAATFIRDEIDRAVADAREQRDRQEEEEP